LRVASASRDRWATDPLSAAAKVREPALGPAEVIVAELRTASAPDLAMLVVAGGQLRQAPGLRRTCGSDERDYNGRIAMNLTRRDLAAAGVLALSATTLTIPAMAATDDEEAVKQAVEALRKAILAQDKAKLEALTAQQLSYSHSDARVEDKPKFIDGVMTRKAVVKSIEFPELTVAIAGNNAIVRHLWVSESELDGKVTNTKIGVLQVWQKQDSGWKLLARASFRLPQSVEKS
jgi:ketosteroid isomerase-like protein